MDDDRSLYAATLDRYWDLFELVVTDESGVRSLEERLTEAASAVFVEDAQWESERLSAPIIGRRAIVEHIRKIRSYAVDGIKSRSPVQYTKNDKNGVVTATWEWTVRRKDGTCIEGMDRVEFVSDGLIKRIHIQAK